MNEIKVGYSVKVVFEGNEHIGEVVSIEDEWIMVLFEETDQIEGFLRKEVTIV